MEHDPLMNQCIICMDNKHPCIQMKNADVVLFVKTCECNYKVHERCLRDWLTKNDGCLICRKPMYYDRNSSRKSVFASGLSCISYTFGLGVFMLIVFVAILLVIYVANAVSV